jgi:plastocyanin
MFAKRFFVVTVAAACLIPAAWGATIKGTVKFEGKAPPARPIQMTADPICAAKHATEPAVDERLVLGEGQTLGNVFVYVKEGLPKQEWPMPTEPLILTQEGCMYTPRVFGVRPGQEIKILNPDGTLHNVHAMPTVNQPFNIAMPQFKTESSAKFDTTEFMFPIKCDVHPWMTAHCAVMEHNFYDTTEKDGAFTIEGLPAGTYTIEAWHEMEDKLPAQTLEVTVAEDETKEVAFSFARP